MSIVAVLREGANDSNGEVRTPQGDPPQRTSLPVLKPVEPIAICGCCNNPVYPDGQCQAAVPRPNSCCLNGEEWRQMKALLDMRNTWIR